MGDDHGRCHYSQRSCSLSVSHGISGRVQKKSRWALFNAPHVGTAACLVLLLLVYRSD